MYSPQSEAGALGAIAIMKLMHFVALGEHETAATKIGQQNWNSSDCGNSGQGCPFEFADMAVSRIQQAANHYANSNTTYESKIMWVLESQVKSAICFAQGNSSCAVYQAQRSYQLQIESIPVLRPSSTSVLFLPGTLFYATMVGKLLNQSNDPKVLEALEDCLEPTGRPNNGLCLFALATVASESKNSTAATSAFNNLLNNVWVSANDSNAFACQQGVQAGKAFLHPDTSGSSHTLSRVFIGVGILLAISIFILVVYRLKKATPSNIYDDSSAQSDDELLSSNATGDEKGASPYLEYSNNA